MVHMHIVQVIIRAFVHSFNASGNFITHTM
jgi:hypothetical protein